MMKTYTPIPTRKAVIDWRVTRDEYGVRIELSYRGRQWNNLPPESRVQVLSAMATALEDLAGQMREEAAMVVDQVMIA